MSDEAPMSRLEETLQDGRLAGSWTLDPQRSLVRLATRGMWGLVPVKGRFTDVSGSAQVRVDGQVTGRLQIAAASVDTGNKTRDRHLRSADFFSADEYPDIVYQLRAVGRDDAAWTFEGRLIVRDRTIPLGFPATIVLGSDDVVTIDGSVMVNRTGVGIDYKGKGATKMETTITTHAVFTHDG